MKKIIIIIVLMLATATSVFAMNLDEAKLQNKPIVVMFHMHGCGSCKKFSPIFDKFASNFSYKFNFVKEDAVESNLTNTLKIRSVPAIFIIQPKTMVATRINNDCAWDKGCFTKTLQEYGNISVKARSTGLQW